MEQQQQQEEEEEEQLGTMSNLPEDIINYNILTRLPLKSISRFRCVCKSWSNLFTNPNFARIQLNHSLKHHNPGILIESNDTNIGLVDYDLVSSTVSSKVSEFDYPEFKEWPIVGVCDGLICYKTLTDDIIIWNPFTKVYKKLPNPPESTGNLNTKDPIIQHGFGYDSKTEDYKFAMMVNSESMGYSELNVYSFRANSWKTMLNIPSVFRVRPLVLFNGIFHWVECPSFQSGLPRVIGSFDYDSETFREIQLPKELLDWKKFSVLELRFLEGCLYLIGSMYMIGVEVWTMKEYGVKESWTKMFTIDGEKFGGLRWYLKLRNSLGNGVILLEAHDLPYSYNLYKEEARRLEIIGIRPTFSTWAFLGSLVSPSFGTCCVHNKMQEAQEG